MKTTILFCAALAGLQSPTSAADSYSVSTTVLTLPPSVDVSRRSRTVTRAEWMRIVRTAAEAAGSRLFRCPDVVTPSEKRTEIAVKSPPAPEPVAPDYKVSKAPVTHVAFTPSGHTKGTEIRGEFTLPPSEDAEDHPISLSSSVHGVVPDGEVLVFQLGEHLIGVAVTTSEDP
ncbi:hypothetical protein ACFQY0_13435 [Haloferula chungangensis]|uniref:Halobacterial output domain-containing protein n=1 Tax=Haloferula chungangensis TaxID=1048331 RepID=A0ABW2L714_9BACT